MKNLRKTEVKDEMVSRINKLHFASKPLWGTMNVIQALKHMALGFEIPKGKLDPTMNKKPPLPKWLLKFLMLHIKMLKQAPTFNEMNMVEHDITISDFETERNNLQTAIEDFYSAHSFIAENKFAGKFSADDWGKLMYNHTNHHLTQFGV